MNPTLQPIPPESPRWNEWLRLARQGDKTATGLFCAQAEPFIEILCKTRYFRDQLETDEIRSIANLAIMEFLKEYPNPPDDARMPYMLKRIIHNKILSALKRQKVRIRREQALNNPQNSETRETALHNNRETIPVNKPANPETLFLQNERLRATLNAFRLLRPSEQALLRSFFYQNKTAAAIAKELHCSRQYVEKVRNKALRHLRQLLEGNQISGSGAFCN